MGVANEAIENETLVSGP